MIRFDHVTYHYSPDDIIPVIQDFTLDLPSNSFIALIGPSGCGKSTLLSLISGLIKPTSGSITYIMNDFEPLRIGYMLQHDHLLEWRTIYQNILLGLEIQRKVTPENKKYIDSLLEKYNLMDVKDEKPSALSGGMRQRVALIRTLALKPNLLLLDEPFSALDYQTRLKVSQDVYQIIKQETISAIFVTHDIAEAVAMADTVIVLTTNPCQIKKIIPIEFEKNGITRETVRSSKLFQTYFDEIWSVL